MNPPVVTATLGLVVLCVFALWFRAPAIEADLRHAVAIELAASMAPAATTATVEVEGRDVILVGQVTSTAQEMQLLGAARSVWGIRSVTSRLRVTDAVAATPAPAPARTPPTAEELNADLAELVNESSVAFETSSHRLSPQGRRTVVDVAQALSGAPEVVVEIGGHTDSTGPKSHNLALSQRRADAVARELQSLGVPASRLRPIGFGSGSPRDSNRSELGRARNRRIEFRVLATRIVSGAAP